MPYVNIPETGLEGSIATQIGKLRGQFESTVDSTLDSVKEDMKGGCLTPEKADTVKTKINSIKDLSVNIKDKLNRFERLVGPLGIASDSILKLVPFLKGLPIPGIALTAGVASTFSDILHLAKEFGTQLRTSKDSIESLVSQAGSLTQVLDKASDLSSRVDTVLEFCNIAEEAGVELNEEELDKIIDGTEGEAALSIQNLNNTLGTSVERTSAGSTATAAFDEGLEEYVGPDGTVYTLKLVEVVSPITRAPQAQAIALNKQGIKRFESSPSFSSTPEILKKELKFNIDNSQV